MSSVYVSASQVAKALGQEPDASFRQSLEKRGINFVARSGKYLAPLARVSRTLGQEIADRVVLCPGQAASFLGLSTAWAASKAIRRLGNSLERDDITVVEWGKLRKVVRVAPRKFKLQSS